MIARSAAPHGVECHVVAVTAAVEHPAFGKRAFVTRWFIGVAVGGDEAGGPAGYVQAHRFACGPPLKGDEVAGRYNVVVLPALYLIGDDGRVVLAEDGYREGSKDELTRMIDGYPEGVLASGPGRRRTSRTARR